jgi:hypothetical protein
MGSCERPSAYGGCTLKPVIGEAILAAWMTGSGRELFTSPAPHPALRTQWLVKSSAFGAMAWISAFWLAYVQQIKLVLARGESSLLGVVSQHVVPVEAEASDGRAMRRCGVWPMEVVVVHPGLQLTSSVL